MLATVLIHSSEAQAPSQPIDIQLYGNSLDNLIARLIKSKISHAAGNDFTRVNVISSTYCGQTENGKPFLRILITPDGVKIPQLSKELKDCHLSSAAIGKKVLASEPSISWLTVASLSPTWQQKTISLDLIDDDSIFLPETNAKEKSAIFGALPQKISLSRVRAELDSGNQISLNVEVSFLQSSVVLTVNSQGENVSSRATTDPSVEKFMAELSSEANVIVRAPIDTINKILARQTGDAELNSRGKATKIKDVTLTSEKNSLSISGKADISNVLSCLVVTKWSGADLRLDKISLTTAPRNCRTDDFSCTLASAADAFAIGVAETAYETAFKGRPLRPGSKENHKITINDAEFETSIYVKRTGAQDGNILIGGLLWVQ